MTDIVIGWVLGFVSKPIGDMIHIWWRGPRLVLNVESDLHEFELTANDSQFRQQTYKEVYVNLEVLNDKPRTAEKCRAWLVRIEKRSGDGYESTDFRDSFPLIWAYDALADAVPILMDVSRRVNVITLRSNELGFTPCFRGENGAVLHPKQYLPIFQEYGAFRFTVVVSAEDAPTRSSILCVERNDGQWPPKVWGC